MQTLWKKVLGWPWASHLYQKPQPSCGWRGRKPREKGQENRRSEQWILLYCKPQLSTAIETGGENQLLFWGVKEMYTLLIHWNMYPGLEKPSHSGRQGFPARISWPLSSNGPFSLPVMETFVSNSLNVMVFWNPAKFQPWVSQAGQAEGFILLPALCEHYGGSSSLLGLLVTYWSCFGVSCEGCVSLWVHELSWEQCGHSTTPASMITAETWNI